MNLLISYILKLIPLRHSFYINRNAENTFFQNKNQISKKSFHDLSCLNQLTLHCTLSRKVPST